MYYSMWPNMFISEFANYFFLVYYRPQRSCGKVLFCKHPPLGRHIPACTGADTPHPPCQTYPGMHWGRYPQADISQHALGQTYPSRHPPPPPSEGHCSRRYASYRNAFLLYGLPAYLLQGFRLPKYSVQRILSFMVWICFPHEFIW